MSEESAPRRSADETAAGEPAPGDARRFTMLLLATAGVVAVLALVLFLVFAALGYGSAPFAAVGVATVGGVVMRRMLLDAPSVQRVLLFTAGTIAGALLGLGVGNLILS